MALTNERPSQLVKNEHLARLEQQLVIDQWLALVIQHTLKQLRVQAESTEQHFT